MRRNRIVPAAVAQQTPLTKPVGVVGERVSARLVLHQTKVFFVLGIVVFLLGISVSTWSYLDFKQSEHNTLHDKIQTASVEYAKSIREAAHCSLSSLHIFASSFHYMNYTRDLFEVAATRVLHANKVLLSVQWVPRVRASERVALEAAGSEFANENVTFHDVFGNTIPYSTDPTTEYYPVFYLVPYLPNKRAFLLNLAQNTTRVSEHINPTLTTAEPTASAPVDLVQSGKGFLLFEPVYNTNGSAPPPELRAQLVKGFTVAVMRYRVLLGTVLERVAPLNLVVSLYDTTDSRVNVARFRGDGPEWEPTADVGSMDEHFASTRTFSIGGRQYELEVLPLTSFIEADETKQGFVTFVLSLLLTTLVVAGFLSFVYSRSKRQVVLSQALADATKARQETIAKTKFLSYVFHECRVPFNTVVVGLDTLVATAKLDAAAVQLIDTIRSSIGDGLRIINDVLDLNKIEAGKFELRWGLFDPTTVCEHVKSSFSNLCAENNLKLEVSSEIDPTFPGHVVIDRHRFLQCVRNLISNAVKFTSSGSIEVSLKVRKEGRQPHLMQQTNLLKTSLVSELKQLKADLPNVPLHDLLADHVYFLTLAVKDSGIGIKPDKIQRLFGAFQQVHDRGMFKAPLGSGLGLSFTETIVRLHGGTVDVESTYRQGSTFRIEIPCLASGKGDAISSGVKTPSFSKGKMSGSPISCLLVDDCKASVKMMARMLRTENIEADIAHNGLEAVDRVKAAMTSGGLRYSFIMMDQCMPVMDGHEATRIIRSLDVRVPIIALTGNAFAQEQADFKRAGADAVLTKPVTKKMVLLTLRQQLA